MMRRRAFVPLLAALVGAAILSGCGTVPLPFRGTPKIGSGNPMLDVPSATGVEVLPVVGLPPEASARVGRAVADALLALEIPAEAVGKPGGLGFLLSGRAGASVTSPGGEQFEVDWLLRSRRGAIVGRFAQTVRIPPEPAGAIPTAAETAAEVAAAMGLGDTVAVPTAGRIAAKPAIRSISVKPVEGAPGDGRESLRLAVMQALTDGGLRRDDVDPDIVLTCRFEATDNDIASKQVRITWRAADRAGRELGVLHLDNVVPNGALDGAWGPTAFAIAAAAQPNLLKLIATSTPP